MYAVIFRATINELDEGYFETAQRMRDLAINQYGCTEFVAVTEGIHEVTISYWENAEQIAKWKQDTDHLAAQQEGRSHWYHSYKVEIVEIVRKYEMKPDSQLEKL